MIQVQVISYLLTTKNGSIINLNNLTEDFFSDYKEEFKYIKRHLELYGNVCDVETFLSVFPNFEIIKVEESPEYLVKALYDDYNTRKLAETFNKVRSMLMDGKTEEALTLYKKSQEQLTSGVSLRCVDLINDTSRYNDYIDKITNFDKYYISTGIKELDNIIGGWDKNEELATIVARTNYGKSWILLKCASASAMQGLNVGIYSGEMSERKVGYRFDTLVGHISNGGLTHGNDSIQLEYKSYIDSLPKIVKGSLKVLTPQMISGSANVNALRTFIEQEKLDILYIDQLSLLEDQRKGKSETERMSNISKDLKLLQVLKKVPIISVCQQNREKTDSGNVDTTQIAMSDRIGQDSTCIIFLEKKDDIMKLTLVKSRDSENGKVLSYKADLNYGQFIYIPDENDSNGGKTDIDYKSRYYGNDSNGEDVF